MKKLAVVLAIMVMPLFALNLKAQVSIDPTQNGYISFRQSTTGADVLPSPIVGTDTLVYAAGALSLVHDIGTAVPIATMASTVAMATSLAATPAACPTGQALNAIDAKGNAVTCISIASIGSPIGSIESGAFTYNYAQPAIQAGDTITGSTTLYASQANIPSGVLAVGTAIEVEASGTYDINASQESGAGIIWLRINGIRVASGNFRTGIGIGTNFVWVAHFRAIVRSTGDSGTIDPLFEIKSSTNPYGGMVELTSFNSTAPINTLLTNPIQVEFINASTSDSSTMRQMTVTVH